MENRLPDYGEGLIMGSLEPDFNEETIFFFNNHSKL